MATLNLVATEKRLRNIALVIVSFLLIVLLVSLVTEVRLLINFQFHFDTAGWISPFCGTAMSCG